MIRCMALRTVTGGDGPPKRRTFQFLEALKPLVTRLHIRRSDRSGSPNSCTRYTNKMIKMSDDTNPHIVTIHAAHIVDLRKYITINTVINKKTNESIK